MLAASMAVVKVRVIGVLLMLSLGSSVILWWVTPPVHHTQEDDLPQPHFIKHDDSILWKRINTLQSQNDKLYSQIKIANQRIHDVNKKLQYYKNMNQVHSVNKSGCADMMSVSQCEMIHIAVVCAGHDTTRQAIALIKSILFYRHNPLHFHFLSDTVSELILKTLFKTWRLPEETSYSFLNEPPIINRIVGYITNPLRTAIFGNTQSQSNQGNEIEMVTFSQRSSQSPPVPFGLCCTTGRSPLKSNMRSDAFMKNSYNSPFSPEAMKRSSRRSHMTKRLGSPVRHSPRLLAKQRMQAFNSSTSSLVGSSARNQHSFKVFNTPTPFRPTKFDVKNHRMTALSPQSSSASVFSPEMPFVPDVELMEISQPEKKLNFDAIL